MYYLDTIFTGSGLQYVPNSMKIVTNEGLLFKGTYTDAGGDDLGIAITGGGMTRICVNIGTGASNATVGNYGTALAGGSITPGDKPKFYGTTLFVVAYQLIVTASFGDIIYPTGTFYYRDFNSINQRERFDYAGIKITPNDGLCSNYSSASFTAESSFGTGTLQNRVAGVNSPGYVKFNLGPGNPVDGQYSVANNTSGDGSTNNGIPYGSGTSRVFKVWDIVGDHTGSVDPNLGNLPVAPGDKGGYMLVVNSAYPTGEAYSDVISGLCPNTYYEFSAWIRNICGFCGIDSNSKSTNKPGVLPNLAFTINDIDYYNTGEIPWSQVWVKRGFIYKTGPSETSFKITIKNNAAGGGGNDWVLDDIMLATCYPNLIMSPSDTAKVCAGNIVNLYDTVRSYFNNYTNYCWERSTDGGTTWTSTGVCGSKTPVFKNGMWEYIIDTVFTSVAADSGTFYRVKVATTPGNLTDPNCSVDNSQKVFLKVYKYDCSVLESVLKSFTGRVREDGRSVITWSTLNEDGVRNFDLQKSTDGITFTNIQTLPAVYRTGGQYQYEELNGLNGRVYYRIQINSMQSQSAYSKVISLYQLNSSFSLQVSNNPFSTKLQLEVMAATEGLLEIRLIDGYGRPVRKKSMNVSKGSNSIYMENVSNLPPGMYIINVSLNGQMLQQKLMKSN